MTAVFWCCFAGALAQLAQANCPEIPDGSFRIHEPKRYRIASAFLSESRHRCSTARSSRSYSSKPSTPKAQTGPSVSQSSGIGGTGAVGPCSHCTIGGGGSVLEFDAHPVRQSARAIGRNRDVAEDDTDALLAVGGIGLGLGRGGCGVVGGFGGNLHRARIALRRGFLRLAG